MALGLASLLAVSVSGCQSTQRTADGRVKLSFQIWGTAQ